MQKKQIGWYLIFGGLIIFVLKFITVILSFIGGNPILGLTLKDEKITTLVSLTFDMVRD